MYTCSSCATCYRRFICITCHVKSEHFADQLTTQNVNINFKQNSYAHSWKTSYPLHISANITDHRALLSATNGFEYHILVLFSKYASSDKSEEGSPRLGWGGICGVSDKLRSLFRNFWTIRVSIKRRKTFSAKWRHCRSESVEVSQMA